KVAQELEESHIPWQIRFADASKHSQVGIQQRKEALRPILVHVTTRVFLLRASAHMRLCWVTLRELISFKVFFLQYTTESSFCGRKYATRACAAERTRDVSRVDVPRGTGYPGTSGLHHPCARRSAMSLRPEPLPPIPDTTAAAVRAAFPKGNLYV